MVSTMAELTGIQVRDFKGRAMRTPSTISRDHEAAEMRSRAMTYQQIGDALGMSRQAAYKAVQRAIADIPKEKTEELLALELRKLDQLERRLFEVVERTHVTVARSGKVVYHEGEPVADDAPVMAAIAGLLRISDRRSKLLGLNAPTRHEAELKVTEHTGEVDRAIWERAIEFERWRSTQSTVIDVDEPPALGGGGQD